MKIAVLALLSFMLISCGGSGLSLASPFSGHFIGTWNEDGPDVGTADVTISTSGHVSGTYADTTANQSGTISGSIQITGTTTLTIRVTGQPNLIEVGTWTLSQDGQTLSGSLLNSGPNTNTVDYTLHLQ